MLITFEPTTEKVQVGLGECTPQALPAMTPSGYPYITTPSGYTPVQGTLAAGGTAAFPIMGEAVYNHIGFYDGENKTLLVTKFKMDDADAMTTGLETIATALAADTGAIVLKSDGTLGS